MHTQKMKKQNNTDLFQISIIIFIVIIIGVMGIKRFIYFRPSFDFLPAVESYQDINHGKLHGRFFEVKDSNKPVIVFCHGNAGNLTHRSPKISALYNMGYSVLIFDYCGYGKSKGIPNEQQCYDDASMFVALLRQTHKPEQIVMYGESMGAAVAVYVAHRYGINTVILESSLTSIKHVIQNKFRLLSFLSPLFSEFNTESFLKGYKGRVLMMHSETDELVPYSNAAVLRDTVTKFITIKGDHNSPIIPWNEVDNFIME